MDTYIYTEPEGMKLLGHKPTTHRIPAESDQDAWDIIEEMRLEVGGELTRIIPHPSKLLQRPGLMKRVPVPANHD